MITIKEIAKRAGVSIGTVDRVLHNRGRVSSEAREKVIAVVEEADYKPNVAAQGLAARKKRLKICFIIPEVTHNPFFLDVFEAAEKKTRELEIYGVNVKFLRIASERNEKEISGKKKEFLKEIRDADGLVTLGIEAEEVISCIDEMEQKKKPVIFYNNLIENRKYLAYVGCDYEKAGRLAAGVCALTGGRDAKICIFSQGLKEAASSYERIDGFRKEVQEYYPDMKIEGCWEIREDETENYIQVERMLKECPDTNLVYVANPADYRICELIHRADEKHQIRVITNDVVDSMKKMMKEGMIAATISQEPDVQGALPLELMFRYLAFDEAPVKKQCYTNLNIHILQNLYQN